jgi:hypothetical protein
VAGVAFADAGDQIDVITLPTTFNGHSIAVDCTET